MPTSLTPDQLAFYHEHGYIHVPGLLIARRSRRVPRRGPRDRRAPGIERRDVGQRAAAAARRSRIATTSSSARRRSRGCWSTARLTGIAQVDHRPQRPAPPHQDVHQAARKGLALSDAPGLSLFPASRPFDDRGDPALRRRARGEGMPAGLSGQPQARPAAGGRQRPPPATRSASRSTARRRSRPRRATRSSSPICSRTDRGSMCRTSRARRLLVQLRDPADVPLKEGHGSRGQGMMLAGIDPSAERIPLRLGGQGCVAASPPRLPVAARCSARRPTTAARPGAAAAIPEIDSHRCGAIGRCCRVEAVARPRPNAAIGIELWLPRAGTVERALLSDGQWRVRRAASTARRWPPPPRAAMSRRRPIPGIAATASTRAGRRGRPDLVEDYAWSLDQGDRRRGRRADARLLRHAGRSGAISWAARSADGRRWSRHRAGRPIGTA